MIELSYSLSFILYVRNVILKQLLFCYSTIVLAALKIKNFTRFDYLFHFLEYYIYLPIFS